MLTINNIDSIRHRIIPLDNGDYAEITFINTTPVKYDIHFKFFQRGLFGKVVKLGLNRMPHDDIRYSGDFMYGIRIMDDTSDISGFISETSISSPERLLNSLNVYYNRNPK
jgi:hypothetical protein